jgi:DNA-binding GntR family transcriptional regulator
MIIQFVLPPGEHLVEADLAAQLNVSKTPVREALSLLDAEGLVELAPYKGATVRWLSEMELEEQGFLVDALEEPAYPLVISRITKREMVDAGRVVAQLGRARRRRDRRAFAHLTAEFHQVLFRSIGYARLTNLISRVVGPVGLRYDTVFVYPFDDAWDTMVSLMESRYEALRDGDAARAAEVVREHRIKLRAMNKRRLGNPEIAKYFRDPKAAGALPAVRLHWSETGSLNGGG